MTSFFLLIKSIVFLLAILLLIRITLSNINKYSNNTNKNMKIIEKIVMGKESSIAIVLVCGNYYFMSISQNETKIIKELNDSEIAELEMKQRLEEKKVQEKNQNTVAFINNLLRKINLKKIKNEKKD